MTNQTDEPIRSKRVKPWTLLLTYSPTLLLWLLVLASVSGISFQQWPVVSIILPAIASLSAFITWKLAAALKLEKEKEVKLQENFQLHRSFFERSPAIMFVKDIQGNYQLANSSFLSLLGFEGDDADESKLVGHNAKKIFLSSMADSMIVQDQQVIELRQAMEFQAKWPGREGRESSYFNVLRFPLFDDDGKVIAVGGIADNRTDQINARKALRESEEQFRALVETAPEAVLITTTKGKLLLVNKQAESLFGCSRDELMHKPLNELLPGFSYANHAKPDMADTADRVGQNLISMIAVDTEKVTRPVEVAFSTTETGDQSSITLLIRDMSDRAKLESQLRQSSKMDAIGKLTGGMAHDFNNLLGVIMGNLDLAARKLEKDSPVHKRLDTAKRAAERGAELTKRMLAVARRQPLKPKPTDINLIIRDMADILPRTLGPDIEMKYDIKEQIPNVLVDPSGLENVFLNLAINARDAMPNGGKFYITTDVLHLTEDSPLADQDDMHPGSYVQIAVTDTGEGMTPETLSRVFEPFFTTKERGKGTGLGLAMIYGFAKQSDGNIRIYSEPGLGTTIDIFLPVSTEKAENSPSSDGAEEMSNNTYSEKVLVVDDEYALLEIAVSYLEDMGFEVLAATDGKQALRTMRKNPDIDILLTDIVMPGGINGVELAGEVRRKIPGVKVIYMSGFPSGVIADKSGSDLDAPLIIKPYSRETLASSIDELLAETV